MWQIKKKYFFNKIFIDIQFLCGYYTKRPHKYIIIIMIIIYYCNDANNFF